MNEHTNMNEHTTLKELFNSIVDESVESKFHRSLYTSLIKDVMVLIEEQNKWRGTPEHGFMFPVDEDVNEKQQFAKGMVDFMLQTTPTFNRLTALSVVAALNALYFSDKKDFSTAVYYLIQDHVDAEDRDELVKIVDNLSESTHMAVIYMINEFMPHVIDLAKEDK